MKRLLLIVIITVLFSNNSNCGWIKKDLGLSQFTILNDVFFSDEDNGWIVGTGGLILHTTDKGQNWDKQESGTNSVLKRVYFIDNFKGWIVSDDEILNTANGGEKWNYCISDSITGFNSIYMINDTIGFAVGKGGWMHYTVDGTTWHNRQGAINMDLNDLDFATKDKGVIIGSYGWFQYVENYKFTGMMRMISSNYFLENICFADSLNGFLVGYDRSLNELSATKNFILKSTNSGYDWDIIGYSPSGRLNNLSFADNNHGWFTSTEGYIYYTDDGGLTLQDQYSSENLFLKSIYFVNEKQGWAVGSYGTLLNYDESTGINDEYHQTEEFNVFPNPVIDFASLQINLNEENRIKIEIHDFLGNEIAEIYNKLLNVGISYVNLDMSWLNSGIYFLKINYGTKVSLVKIIIL